VNPGPGLEFHKGRDGSIYSIRNLLPTHGGVFEFFAMAEPEQYLNLTLISRFPTQEISAKNAIEVQTLLTHRPGLTVAGKVFCVTSNGSMSLLPEFERKGELKVSILSCDSAD
jgi:hypothetical protein